MTYLSQAQVDKLLEGINPKRVSKDPKGFSYVEAYELRAMMNRVFGLARWSEEVTDQQMIFETNEIRKKDSREWMAWSVCYRSIVKVTICAPDGTVLAVYTEGATGASQNQPTRSDAHDNALKTSESQAFKRAVANIGDAFGLSLWNKGSLNPIVFKTLHYPFGGEREQTDVDSHVTDVAPEDAAPDPVPDPREHSESPTAQPDPPPDAARSDLPDRYKELILAPIPDGVRPQLHVARILANLTKDSMLHTLVLHDEAEITLQALAEKQLIKR